MKRKPTTYDLALWAALPMVHSSRIEARLKGILDTTRRRALARPLLTLLIASASGLALTVATAYTPPSSLVAAITSDGYRSDTPAHIQAKIALLQEALRRFGDKDPWAGKAYYLLGSVQMDAGQYGAAQASFNRCLQLPEPPYSNSGIHLSAEYERINDLESAGRYQEALKAAQAFIQTAPHETQRAFYRANVQSRMADFRLLRDLDANQAAEKAQYRTLTAAPRWTQSLHNGATVQLLGVMQSQGKTHTVWSPDGRLLSRARYTSESDGRYAPRDPLRQVQLILHFSYPTGQAIITNYAVPEAKSIAFESGLERSNGVIQTDEEQMRPLTAGRRTVDAWFSPAERTATLRVGVTVGLPSDQLEQQGDSEREWVEFGSVAVKEIK